MKLEFPGDPPEGVADFWRYIASDGPHSSDLLDILEVAQNHIELRSTLPGIYCRLEIYYYLVRFLGITSTLGSYHFP